MTIKNKLSDFYHEGCDVLSAAFFSKKKADFKNKTDFKVRQNLSICFAAAFAGATYINGLNQLSSFKQTPSTIEAKFQLGDFTTHLSEISCLDYKRGRDALASLSEQFASPQMLVSVDLGLLFDKKEGDWVYFSHNSEQICHYISGTDLLDIRPWSNFHQFFSKEFGSGYLQETMPAEIGLRKLGVSI